jgi:cytochrome c556
MNAIIKSSLLVLCVVATAGLSSSAQTAPVHRVMRDKLEHSQKVLEAVVTSNWAQLDREARALAKATQDPAWSVLQMPEYVRYSQAFLRATDNLTAAAEQRDLEAASLGFISLSTSCVSCHRYLSRARTVTLRP